MLASFDKFNKDDFFNVIIIGVNSDDLDKPDFKERVQSDNHHNSAVEHALEYLRSLESPQRKLGVLVINQPKCYAPTPDESGALVDRFVPNPFVINNIYSHILNDKSNWVTVLEALTYLKELKNKIWFLNKIAEDLVMIVVGLFLSLSFIFVLSYLCITTKDPVFIFTLFFILSLFLACYLGYIPVPNIISL